MCEFEEDEDALVACAWEEWTSFFGLEACGAADFLQRESVEVFHGS